MIDKNYVERPHNGKVHHAQLNSQHGHENLRWNIYNHDISTMKPPYFPISSWPQNGNFSWGGTWPRHTETLTSALVTGSGSKRCLTRPDHFLQQRMEFWTAQKGFNEVTKSQNQVWWRCQLCFLDCPKACIQGVCCSIFHVGPMTWPRTTEGRQGADQSTSRVKHLNLPEALSRHCK